MMTPNVVPVSHREAEKSGGYSQADERARDPAATVTRASCPESPSAREEGTDSAQMRADLEKH